jgi:LysM repeat protein
MAINTRLHMTRRTVLLFLMALVTLSACNLQQTNKTEPLLAQENVTATETIPPYTPLATLTPSQTLRPPPTFEPPTRTPAPTLTPIITPTATLNLNIAIPGLHGLETPTPSTTPGCVPRKDWKLRYTVQRGDALARIADHYSTTVQQLVAANCLTDPNVIVIGQELRVPGEIQPVEPAVECVPWEVLTPIDNSFAIPGAGQMTFNWRGPRAPRNLIRVIKPDGGTYEQVIELRQNQTIDLADIPLAGTYTWYVFPLDWNFAQVSCKEGGPWHFTKEAAPTPTPTPNFSP